MKFYIPRYLPGGLFSRDFLPLRRGKESSKLHCKLTVRGSEAVSSH